MNTPSDKPRPVTGVPAGLAKRRQDRERSSMRFIDGIQLVSNEGMDELRSMWMRGSHQTPIPAWPR
jgi:hypothetical protein